MARAVKVAILEHFEILGTIWSAAWCRCQYDLLIAVNHKMMRNGNMINCVIGNHSPIGGLVTHSIESQ